MNVKLNTNGVRDIQAAIFVSALSFFILLLGYDLLIFEAIFLTIPSFFLGYSAISTIFPGRISGWDQGFISTVTGSRGPTIFERIIFSIFLSISGASSIAIIIEIFELNPDSTFRLQISILSLFIALLAYYRRVILNPEDRFTIEKQFEIISFRDADVFSRVIFFSLFFISLFSLYIASSLTDYDSKPERYTELYVLDGGGSFEEYPNFLQPGEEATITFVVSNKEEMSTDYILQISNIHYSPDPTANKTTTLQNEVTLVISREFILSHDNQIQITYEPQFEESGLWGIEASLFKNESQLNQDPYREVFLWVEVN